MAALQTYLQTLMESQQYGTAAGWVLLAGLLASLSPCVYPLIPITLSVLGTRRHPSRWGGFLLALTYVGGMVVLYTSLGVLFASAGLLFGSLMQSFWVTFSMGVFFVAMALSLLGLFTFRVPQRALLRFSNYEGAEFYRAFAMGLVAGIIAAPCTGPVLAFILTLIAAKQDVLRGAVYMLLFAVGMGLPFLLLGTFSQMLLHVPKAGRWMNGVKIIFGIAMLVVAGYYFQLSFASQKPSSPLLQWVTLSTQGSALQRLKAIEEEAKREQKPVIVDFYADWCAACKELDTLTYADAKVAKALERFQRIKIDLTQENEELRELQRQFKVMGLPLIMFRDSQGNWLKKLNIYGYIKPEEFLNYLSLVK